MSSYYDFSGYALDSGHPRDTMTSPSKPEPVSGTNMESFLNDAWSLSTELHSKLALAQQAEEQDDKGEEFVERIGKLINVNARLQEEICKIIYQHNRGGLKV